MLSSYGAFDSCPSCLFSLFSIFLFFRTKSLSKNCPLTFSVLLFFKEQMFFANTFKGFEHQYFLQTNDFPFLILVFVAFCDCVCHLRLDNGPCWIRNVANNKVFNFQLPFSFPMKLAPLPTCGSG